MAAAEARSGDTEQAMVTSAEGLERDRKSLPSLIMVGQELAELVKTGPGRSDFRRHLAPAEVRSMNRRINGS